MISERCADIRFVVAVDGYVARDYTGFHGGSPWDIREEGGAYDFDAYFRELVAHIDGAYRTLTSRRSRAISGLSMGGFMSLYLSARYPDLIGSASSFNPGPEFYVGEKGRRLLWRPKDHVGNHTRTMARLIRASGDYISQYHEETREAYARADEVAFEYRRDEYHRRLLLMLTYDGWRAVTKKIDALVIPELIETAREVMILDGRAATLNVFRQKGDQGGGGGVTRAVTEGRGNGNGILEPGEEATIWLRLRQGLDPFDKNNWYRAKVYTDSRWIVEVGDLQEQKQLEWTSAKERTSVIRLAADTPPGARIPLHH